MSEPSCEKEHLSHQPSLADIVLLLKTMQKQLGFLEKKIDVLVSQDSGKFDRERHFKRPFKPFGKDSGRPFFKRDQDTRGHSKDFWDKKDRGYHQGRKQRKSFSGHPSSKDFYDKPHGVDGFQQEAQEKQNSRFAGPERFLKKGQQRKNKKSKRN